MLFHNFINLIRREHQTYLLHRKKEVLFRYLPRRFRIELLENRQHLKVVNKVVQVYRRR